MAGTSTALLPAVRAARDGRPTGRLAQLLLVAVCGVFGCRDRVTAPVYLSDAAAGAAFLPAFEDEPDVGQSAEGGGGAVLTSGSAGEGGGPAQSAAASEPPVMICPGRELAEHCSVAGESTHGVRIIGTLLEPAITRQLAVLDIDAAGIIRCAGCDCGDAGAALVIDCPGLVISPGLINLHDHLSYAGTPPLSHPGELYEHRSDWRLGENGHAPLPFEGGASTAEVLAHELRMVMGGATAIVGAGGRRGLLRNLDVAGLTELLLPGAVRAETFPLNDAAGALDPQSCNFGKNPDSAEESIRVQAYVAHLGEGTTERAADELRCALGSLDLLRPNSAIVHAMALSRNDAAELAARGSSVVWSPRSNLDLYGSTAPVALLSGLGVRIALGTDWLASGSMNLLRELSCARQYDAQVLGGYFNSTQLWRMVTENAAWALGLERRIGELRPGLVGDVAVFTERTADLRASVVDAAAPDVRLVLRQGTPLYGDAELVKAFRGSEDCEELTVCERVKSACTAETGLALSEIVEAGQAVHPLFSCTAPEAEPSCQATVQHDCPFGESTCRPPRREPTWEERDTDADGVADHVDLCPRVADAEQVDADRDGKGDACDDCPRANPGLLPCPLTIAQLRAPSSGLPEGLAVSIATSRVTALQTEGAKGFYVEDGDHAAYSGIFVYTDEKTPTVGRDELVSLQGYFGRYRGTDELLAVDVLSRRASASPYAPLEVSLADIADDSTQAVALAALFVRISEVEVAATNADAPEDYDETALVGGLRLDDMIWRELDNQFAVGTRLRFVQGISGRSFSHQKLWPTRQSDLGLPSANSANR
jgi:cytosine/adenosine deaminase-related metal-dependent hydrolase